MKILITGAAGTLGTELCKQLLDRGDSVVAVDNCEWAVAQLFDHPNMTKVLGCFGDMTGKYDLIIAAAAYKHIDLIEKNQQAGFWNNVMLLEKLYNQVKGQILFISTDKAVEPSSYYGKTKKIGEKLTFERNGIVARLGNIMASSGSVIPKWEKCIEEGKPLPITDPDMTRYMIPVEDAVKKILALLPKAKAGQVIIPEMGQPLKLEDIANKVLSEHDEDWTTYPKEIIGLRPGEKMHEKLHYDYEKSIYHDEYGDIYIDNRCKN